MTNVTPASYSNVRFNVDFIKNQIVGTKASFNKAGKGFGPEYEELTAKLIAHPTFALVVKSQEKKSNEPKRTYKGMDYLFMEAFIAIQKNSETIRKEYDAYKKFAKEAGMNVYPATKKWFIQKFGGSDRMFNMDEAQEAIRTAQYVTINGKVSAELAETASTLNA